MGDGEVNPGPFIPFSHQLAPGGNARRLEIKDLGDVTCTRVGLRARAQSLGFCSTARTDPSTCRVSNHHSCETH